MTAATLTSSYQGTPSYAQWDFGPLREWEEKAREVKSAQMFGGNGNVLIYAMVGADDRVVYVGKTTQTLAKRLEWHRKKPVNVRVQLWLSGNPDARLVPIYRTTRKQWEVCERFWIRWGRSRWSLLNRHRGGSLGPLVGGEVIAKARARLGKPITKQAAYAARVSARQMCRGREPEPAPVRAEIVLEGLQQPGKRKKRPASAKAAARIAWDKFYHPMPGRR